MFLDSILKRLRKKTRGYLEQKQNRSRKRDKEMQTDQGSQAGETDVNVEDKGVKEDGNRDKVTGERQ